MIVTGISHSSDKKLSHCEQQYSYRYDEKLKPKLKAKGLYMGDWMHQLYQAHYLFLARKSKETWEKAFKRIKAKMWDELFDEQKELYEEKGFSCELAHDLMGHYVEHWDPQEKHWKILAVEGSYEMNVKSLGVPIRFILDLIIEEKGLLCLVETKNYDTIPDASQRILNPQPHSYCYLYWKKTGQRIQRIIWNYVRTSPVTSPTINKDGSISKRKIETDQRTYLKFLKENKIHPVGEEGIQLQAYIDRLPPTLSLERVSNAPNYRVGEMFVKDWIERARRAREIKRPTRTFDRSCTWMCDYYSLCLADMTGKPDRNTIIKKDFIDAKKLQEDWTKQ